MTGKDLLQKLVWDIKSLYSTVQAEASAGSDSHCYDDDLISADRNLALLNKYRNVIDRALESIEIEEPEYEEDEEDLW